MGGKAITFQDDSDLQRQIDMDATPLRRRFSTSRRRAWLALAMAASSASRLSGLMEGR